MTRPISPFEVGNKKIDFIPSEVIEAFNELIVKAFSGGTARVVQQEVVDLALEKMKFNRPRVPEFDSQWLNVEELYEAEGWDVEYDKPGYNESYEAFFVFKKVQKGSTSTCQR